MYVGFGSAAPDPEGSRAAARGSKEVETAQGTRNQSERHGGPQVIEIEGAPHNWLFPRMAAAVHHVGAGTTAEGLRTGKLTAVFPSNFGDQLFWGKRIHALEAGPEPVPQKKLTIERLAAALRAVTEDEGMRHLTEELGEEIRAENGVARAVEIVGQLRRTP